MGYPYPQITFDTLETLLKGRFEAGFLTLKDLPHPYAFKDMDKAVERIVKAIRSKEKITIIGDYDVDGVVSTTMMKLFFDEIDYPIQWIIPNRFEDGYGLSPSIVAKIKGCDLAVTVDNGISAIAAARMCKEEGIELIITDHHIVGEVLPDAYALVNQKQKDCTFPHHDICGAQIAWYLIAAIKNALEIKINMLSYMELAALAIIADVMPLLHINRAMVIAGLHSLSKSSRPFIRAFFEQTGKESLDTEEVGFFLAPLLNSAGRMDDASHAVDFLCSTNIYDARVRLERLQEFNGLRKETEETITSQALCQVEPSENIIVTWGEGWHEGVVGIVAARVARIHQKPTIVLSCDEEGTLKGSGRTYHGYDLFDIVNQCSGYLEKFGGHRAAVGLSLDRTNLSDFKEALQNAFLTQETQRCDVDPDVVGEIDFSLLNFDLLALMKQYEPYGEGNPKPKFISRDVTVNACSTMGKDQNHLRFILEKKGVSMAAVKFKTVEQFEIGSLVNITYTISENNYKGNISLQLLIDNIEYS